MLSSYKNLDFDYTALFGSDLIIFAIGLDEVFKFKLMVYYLSQTKKLVSKFSGYNLSVFIIDLH